MLFIPLLTGCVLQDVNEDLAYKLLNTGTDTKDLVEWEALALYEQTKDDYSESKWDTGPCLGRINDEWVVDMVHNPMTDLDYDMDNQCEEYYDEDSEIKHYVLILMDGEVWRSE